MKEKKNKYEKHDSSARAQEAERATDDEHPAGET